MHVIYLYNIHLYIQYLSMCIYIYMCVCGCVVFFSVCVCSIKGRLGPGLGGLPTVHIGELEDWQWVNVLTLLSI